jgi:hypothetical protein
MRVRTYFDRARLAALASLTSALAACSLGYMNPNFLISKEARERVEEAAIRYNNSLRFGNLEMAAQWVTPELRREFLQVFGEQASSPIRFTDVEVQSVDFGPGRGEARILLSARLYRLPSLREISLIDEQQWHYDPDTQTWLVTPDLARYASFGQPASPQVNAPASPPLD